MCGIIGLFLSNSSSHVSQSLVDALTVLQHRGQDAAGIVTISKNKLNLIKDNGTVADVFTQENVTQLQGNIGIGHVRYPTAGGSCSAEAQPFYTNSPFGIALAHNGNLTNTNELAISMAQEYRHINTNSDSEILLNVFAEELQRRLRNRELLPEDIFDAVRTVMRRCKGSYAVVLVINNVGLVAFRDPHGIRPLCFGSRKANPTSNSPGTDYAIASESVAIDILGPSFHLDRDVKAGEALFISYSTGQLHTQVVHPNPSFTPCLFEYVYFARPDSILDGVSVYEARINMGLALAKKITLFYSHLDIDVVIPIPETSRTAALHCAFGLQKPYREGFVKNRYIARTFIMPGQEMRRKTVRLKLNTITSEFKNKNVLLIDDSIVRGTTSKELIQMAKDAGAKRVYFASAAPPVKYPNVYGIDIPTRSELIACQQQSEADIAIVLQADEIIYNELSDVIASVTALNPSIIKSVDSSCFDGVYVTGDITPEYLDNLELGRGKGRKTAVNDTIIKSNRSNNGSINLSPGHDNSPNTIASPRTNLPLRLQNVIVSDNNKKSSDVDDNDNMSDGSTTHSNHSPLNLAFQSSISTNSLYKETNPSNHISNACEGIHNQAVTILPNSSLGDYQLNGPNPKKSKHI